MGCDTSKLACNHAARQGWSAPFARSMLMPSRHQAEQESDNYQLVSMTSTSYDILKSDFPDYRAEDGRSFISLARKRHDLLDSPDLSPSYWSDVQQLVTSMKLKPVTEEDEISIGEYGEAETINTWELMEGLEDAGQNLWPIRLEHSPFKGFESERRSLLDRSLSFHTVQEAESYFAEMGSPNYSAWRKYLEDEEIEMQTKGSSRQDASMNTLPRQSFSFVSPTSRQCLAGPATNAAPPLEPVDGQTGLRMLFSPVSSSTSTTETTTTPFEITRSGFDADLEGDCVARSPFGSPSVPSPGWMTTPDGLEEHVVPLFDPALMAAFEKALEATSEDDRQNIDASQTTSFDLTTSLSGNNSDADFLPMRSDVVPSGEHDDGSDQVVQDNKWHERKGNDLLLRADGGYLKKSSSSKISPINFDEENTLNKRVSLESFEVRCPPDGEEKAVLYVTGLRGVRKTYEDCCDLRMILEGLGVDVDERDIWMHAKFLLELNNVLGRQAMPLPRLFIKGRYIGGAEEVRQLHEDGTLATLVEGLPTDVLRQACDGCGDVRFVPCFSCNGSCKLLSEDTYQFTRCPDCNENGLVSCPFCCN